MPEIQENTNEKCWELSGNTFPCPFCSLEVSSKEVIDHLRKHICCGYDCEECKEKEV